MRILYPLLEAKEVSESSGGVFKLLSDGAFLFRTLCVRAGESSTEPKPYTCQSVPESWFGEARIGEPWIQAAVISSTRNWISALTTV